MTGLGIAVAVLLLLCTSLLYVPFRWRPVGIYLFTFKVCAVAFVPFIALAGIALAALGVLFGSWWIVAPAALAAVGATTVVVRVASVRPDLAAVLGDGWEHRIPPERRARMVGRLWRGRLPRDPEPRVRWDVPFATVPGTDRALLCDIWQPPAGVSPSGVTVVFLHGSGYYVFDKDFLTRRLFTHFAAQGHVVMDVAHRLFPDADVTGMVHDAKRAVAWVRTHAADLGVDPDKVVLTGGSSGGHLSLLAGYAHDDPILTPRELIGADPRVRAVVSLYGQVGLAELYEHTGQQKFGRPDDPQPDWNAQPSRAMQRLFGASAARLRLQFMPFGGRCDWLVGGTPAEAPERYAQFSALEYIHKDCPPTLLMHGTHDEMAPIAAVRRLRARLVEAGVPVTAVYLPHTDHMLEVVTGWSPAARLAVHVLERFLAVIGTTDQVPADTSRRERSRHVVTRDRRGP